MHGKCGPIFATILLHTPSATHARVPVAADCAIAVWDSCGSHVAAGDKLLISRCCASLCVCLAVWKISITALLLVMQIQDWPQPLLLKCAAQCTRSALSAPCHLGAMLALLIAL